MKKALILIMFIILLTSCQNSKDIFIKTSLNKDDYSIIEYPIFNINVLDKKIKEDITAIEKYYNKQKKDNSELNIDFAYEIINEKYISIIIKVTTYIENKKENIYTYLFDKDNNSFIKVTDIVNKNTLLNLVKNEFKNKYNIKINNNINLDKVYISKSYLNFYITKNKKDFFIQVPLSNLDFSFNFSLKNEVNYNDIVNNNNNNNVIDINKPIVALTFDDGPSIYTNDILNILKNNNICATFFVLGNKVSYHQDILLKMLENGNEIGNHTYNHKWLAHLNEIEIKEQLSKTQEIIFEYTRYIPKVFRPSYGDIEKSIQKEISLEITLWTVDTLDWKLKNKNKIISRATNNVKDGDIILMHDTYKRTRDSLPKIIKILKEKGFQFVTVSELNEIKKLRKYNE